jgi:hypothetical protein
MTDNQPGLPHDDPGRIPDRPLPQQPKPAMAGPSSHAIPEQQLSNNSEQLQPAASNLQEIQAAPYPVSPSIPQPAPSVALQSAPKPAFTKTIELDAMNSSVAADPTAIPPIPPGAKKPPPVKAKRNWGDLKLLATYYFTVVNEVVFSPGKLFAQAAASPDLVEPAIFMAISIGICSILQIISGDIGGIFRFVGKIFCVLASAFITTYALKLLDSKGDFRNLFKIYAYSQGPMIIGWIKLGALNVGGLIAVVCSLYLSVVGLEEVYKVQRTQASVIVLVVGLIVWGIAKLLGIL